MPVAGQGGTTDAWTCCETTVKGSSVISQGMRLALVGIALGLMGGLVNEPLTPKGGTLYAVWAILHLGAALPAFRERERLRRHHAAGRGYASRYHNATPARRRMGQ